MKYIILIIGILIYVNINIISGNKVCLGYYEEEKGKILFGDQFYANYSYVKIGSTVTLTINSFQVDDFLNIEGVKSLSADFPCNTKKRICKTDENGIGVLASGYCFSNQQQMLISYYYFKNQYIYIQLLSQNTRCNKFVVFGTSLVWNTLSDNNNNDSNNNNNNLNNNNNDNSNNNHNNNNNSKDDDYNSFDPN